MPASADATSKDAATAKDAGRKYAPRGVRKAAHVFMVKEVGLRVLASLVKNARMPVGGNVPEGHKGLQSIRAVGAMLASLEPRALFDDWAPPTAPPDEPVAIGSKNASSSTNKGDTNKPAQALTSGMTTYWSSKASPDESKSMWMATFDDGETDLATLTLAAGAAQVAETVEVQVRTGGSAVGAKAGSKETWSTLYSIDGSRISSERRLIMPRGTRASAVRLYFKGFSKDNKDKQHTLAVFAATRPKPHGLFNDTASVLASVERWLAAGAVSEAPNVRAAALSALQHLAIATGSLSAVLRLTNVLLRDDVGFGASPGAGDDGKASVTECNAFLKRLDDQFDGVCQSLQTGGALDQVDAIFDEHGGGVTVSDGGKTVTSTGGSAHAIVNVPIATGRATWEYKLVTDSRNGECTCFGICVKPLNASNYDNANVWMYRAYNGQLYERSRSTTQKAKFHPGDTVKFDLDMDAGTLSASVNGAPQGVLFSSLAGNVVFPAICFYSSGRKATLVSLEVAGAAGACYLAQGQAAKDQGGIRGVGSELGADDKSIVVKGADITRGLSMLPPAEGEVTAEFAVEKPEDADTFEASVALNDDIGEAKTEAPVVFEVVDASEDAGDRSLWKSPEISTAGDVHAFQIRIAGVKRLRIKVSTAGPSTHAHAVWVDPVIRRAPWLWEKKKLEETAGAARATASTFAEAAGGVLSLVQLFSKQAMRGMRTSPPFRPYESGAPLETPFAVQADGGTFEVATALLRQLESKMGDDSTRDMVLALLAVLKANLRRLAVSGTNPEDAGIKSGSGDKDAEEKKDGGASGEQDSKEEGAAGGGTLGGLHALLTRLAGQPGEPVPAGVPLVVAQEAAEVLDIGLELFYPTPAARQALLQSLVSTGGVVEAHFLWPAKNNKGEVNADGNKPDDTRYERAVLLLQSHCRKAKWRCATVAEYGLYVHAIIELPTDSPSSGFLDEGIAGIMTTAGFGSWQFPLGCADPEIKLKIERHAKFNRVDRVASEPGEGWVRLYPRGVGSFDEVVSEVEAFVDGETARKAADKAKAEAEKAEAGKEKDKAAEGGAGTAAASS